MNILITGGAGLIGSHLVEYHLSLGDEVLALDNLRTGDRKNIELFLKNKKFTFENIDITHWKSCAQEVSWADRIYHMAAVVGMYYVLEHPLELIETNLFATANLLKAIHKSPKAPVTLLATTSEVYGPVKKREPLIETQDLILDVRTYKRTNYAVSKLANEIIGRVYYERYGLPIVMARIFNTTGPRQTKSYGMVVPRFVDQAIHHQPITVFGDGTQTRCFCNVRDTVEFLNRLAGNPQAYGKVINVGSDEEVSIINLAKLIITLAGSESEIQYIPYDEAYGTHFEDIHYRKPNLDLLYSLTQYKHQWSLEKTILDLIGRKKK